MYKTIGTLFIIGVSIVTPVHAGWTPPVRISDEAPSYGPRIVTNGDTLHVAYWIWNGHAECYYVRSVDNGESWATPFYLSDTLISSGEDSPEIHICGDTVVAIWYQDISADGQLSIASCG